MNKSKYYNLEKHGARWTADEFSFVVLTLESLSVAQLRQLCDRFGIRFSGGNEAMDDDEEFISALILDTRKEELMEALKKLQ